MRKYRNQIITGFILVFAIYVALLIFFDGSGQFDGGVLDELLSYPLLLIPILCLTQVSAGFFRFLEWHYFLGVIDARNKITLKDSLIIFISSFTMVVSPGKVAEVLKSVFLRMKTDVPIAVSAPIVVAERVVDGLAVVITLVFTLLISGDQLELGDYRGISEKLIFTSAALLGSGLIVVQIQPLAYFFLGLVEYIPIVNRFQKPLTDFYESSHKIFKIKHVIPTILMGIGVYMSSTVGFFLIMLGFGTDASFTLFLNLAFIVGVSSAVGALSFVPNGAGVTELTNLGMLTALVLPNHPELTPAILGAAALMEGFFHKWFRVVIGLGVMIGYRKRLFTNDLEVAIAEMEAEKSKNHGVIGVVET